MRSCMNQSMTSVALGAASMRALTLPVWSTSSWLMNTQRMSSGSTSENTSSRYWSRFSIIPVSTTTGSAARMTMVLRATETGCGALAVVVVDEERVGRDLRSARSGSWWRAWCHGGDLQVVRACRAERRAACGRLCTAIRTISKGFRKDAPTTGAASDDGDDAGAEHARRSGSPGSTASPSPTRRGATDRSMWSCVPPLAQNIELAWERPEYRAFFARLGCFARVLHFDKRGTGASDRTARLPTVDQRVEDLVAVMDAAGFERAHLLGLSEGGPVAIALAATYPERVETLTLFGSGARIVGDETDEERDARLAGVRYFHERWGTEESVTLDVFGPSVAGDAGYRAWEPRYERQSATPAALGELLDMVEAIDVRPLLGAVSAPTLILHRRDDHDRVRRPGPRDGGAAAPRPARRARRRRPLRPRRRRRRLGRPLRAVRRRHRAAACAEPAAAATSASRRWAASVSTSTASRLPASAWGSRQARLVCKRLAVAVDRPVPRDELAELLWPDELDPAKRSARLSVVLSNIRRVLGGGLVADRDAVRLDLDARRPRPGRRAARRWRPATTPPSSPPTPGRSCPRTPTRTGRSPPGIGSPRRSSAPAAGWPAPPTPTSGGTRSSSTPAPCSSSTPSTSAPTSCSCGRCCAAGRRGEAQVAVDRYRERMTELGVQPRDLLDPQPRT